MVEYNKLIEINGSTYKYCKTCEDLLPINRYYPIPNNKVGFNVRCKGCEIKMRREKYEARKPVWYTPDDILKGMGYDLNKDIHEQFCIRHGLTYKPKDN